MSTFVVTSDDVLLGTAAPGANDPYLNGVLVDNATGTLNRATTGAGSQWSNGLFRNNSGQVVYVDATLGLPSPVYWSNGLPFDSGGALCISTDPMVSYSNGVPFAANGAVAAGVVPS